MDLNDFFRGQPGALMIGGRVDIDIRVDRVLAGAPTPTAIKARAALTHLIKPKARLLILLKQGPVEPGKDNTAQEWSGGFISRASAELPWRVVLVASGPPGSRDL